MQWDEHFRKRSTEPTHKKPDTIRFYFALVAAKRDKDWASCF